MDMIVCSGGPAVPAALAVDSSTLPEAYPSVVSDSVWAVWGAEAVEPPLPAAGNHLDVVVGQVKVAPCAEAAATEAPRKLQVPRSMESIPDHWAPPWHTLNEASTKKVIEVLSRGACSRCTCVHCNMFSVTA